MDNFLINGGRAVRGEVKVSGSKNAALPILMASILTSDKMTIENVPDLTDVRFTKGLLEYLGKKTSFLRGVFVIEENRKLKHKAPYNLVRKMRASVLVMGPLLARFGHARVALPGGCSIGVRPVNIHLDALKNMGARLYYKNGDEMLFGGNLKGGRIKFPFPSVGATENAMMCASLIKGRTIIENCAREPEISDLAEVLRKMGASINGDGTRRMIIEGREKLCGVWHKVVCDRIETGTFLILAAITGGRLILKNTDIKYLPVVAGCLAKSGASIKTVENGIEISGPKRPRPVSIRTAAYPGFPTDLQPLWTAYMSVCSGKCFVEENIFENRFMYVAELLRMGANIRIEGKRAFVNGVEYLKGAPVMAGDIRGGAALAVACAAARGKSVLRRVYHIDRGYEKLEKKMRKIRVSIIRRKNI